MSKENEKKPQLNGIEDKLYVDIDFRYKDCLKALGLQFDWQMKKWYLDTKKLSKVDVRMMLNLRVCEQNTFIKLVTVPKYLITVEDELEYDKKTLATFKTKLLLQENILLKFPDKVIQVAKVEPNKDIKKYSFSELFH